MSDEKSQQQEPTMEEILASIRRIISENDDGDSKPGQAKPKPDGKAAPAAQAAPQAAATPPANEDILELTEVVEEGQRPNDPAAPSGDDLVMEDVPGPKPVPPTAPGAMAPDAGPVEIRPEPPLMRSVPPEALVSDATETASTAALAQLARALDRDQRSVGNIGLGSGNTLEDLVKDMIRPMLKEWLDRNLAPLVERLVRREIERMVRRAEDDS